MALSFLVTVHGATQAVFSAPCEGDSPIFAAETVDDWARTAFVPRKLGQSPRERLPFLSMCSVDGLGWEGDVKCPSRKALSRHFCRTLAVVVLGLAKRCIALLPAVWLILPAPAHGQSVWELTPYRVRVVVAASNAPELQGVPQQLVEQLSPRLESLLGAAWQVEVVPEEELSRLSPPSSSLVQQTDASGGETRRSSVTGIEELRRLPAGAMGATLLPEAWIRSDCDKLFLLRVDPAIDGWRVRAREWDAATWCLGPVVGCPVRQPAKLRDAALQMVFGAFRPLARIERVEAGEEGQRAVLRLRAAGLPAHDSDLHRARTGQLFCPMIRLHDREGRLRRDEDGNPIVPQAVPWTFLEVERVEEGALTCRVQSGLRSPLSGSRRGRVERLALAIVPRQAATRLTVVSRRDPHEPIPGYEVFVQKPGEKATRLLGRTDRAGSIDVGPTEEPLAFLLVRSGQQLLARLPVAAGFAAELTAYVPDDTQRLEAEAFVTAVQEQLVDTVTRRQVLLSRAEAQLEAGRTDEAKQLLAQVYQLPDRATLHRRLVTRQARLRAPDPHVQRQVETLFGDTAKLLDRHLDPSPVEALAQAIAKQSRPRSAPTADLEK